MKIMTTVYENPNYGNVLVKDGKETFCPFQPPIPMPGENGGFTLMRLPCSTNCPHASLDEDTNEYVITCTEQTVVFKIEKQEEEAEEEKKVFTMKKLD
jgi:hypothetical protein